MMMDVLYGAAPRVSSLMDVPAAVDEAFECALAKRPNDRPGFIESWADELAALLAQLPAGDTAGWPLSPSEVAGQPPSSDTRRGPLEETRKV
jgi:hypothetical protein